MKNCGHQNVRRHKEIKNGEQYIVLYIFLELDISYKREVASLVPSYYVGQSGKGMNNSIKLRTRKRSNKKKKTGNVNTEDSYQDIVKITEEFKMHPFLKY